MKKGFLIDIEGTDGSGKHTQTGILCQRLISEGVPVKQLSFPYYDSQSSALIKMYLGGEFGPDPGKVNPFAASMFYAADRFASYTTDWGSFYRDGGIVITDRYTNSNAIHQGSKLPASEREQYLRWLYDLEYNRIGIPSPDAVIYLDVATEVSARLRAKREQNTNTTADIHEKDNAYLAKCRQSALQIAKDYGWHIIRCDDGVQMRTVDEISNDIFAFLADATKTRIPCPA